MGGKGRLCRGKGVSGVSGGTYGVFVVGRHSHGDLEPAAVEAKLGGHPLPTLEQQLTDSSSTDVMSVQRDNRVMAYTVRGSVCCSIARM